MDLIVILNELNKAYKSYDGESISIAERKLYTIVGITTGENMINQLLEDLNKGN